MIYADNELLFNDAWIKLKSKISSTNVDLIKYIDDLACRRSTYSKYLISGYEGSMFLKGSSACESNHSSVISHIDANIKRYKVSLDIFVRDLLKRQKELTCRLSAVISESIFERQAVLNSIHRMEGFTVLEIESLLLPSLSYLNLPVFKLFVKECEASK